MLSGQLGVGGVPKVILDISKYIQDKVDSVEVAYLGGSSEGTSLFDTEGIPTQVLGKSRFDPRLATNLLQYTREFDPDIIHTHMASASALGRIISSGLGIKTISTVHNIYNKRSTIARMIDHPTSILSDVIVTVTDAVQSSLPRTFAPLSDRITIHNGIDVEYVRSKGIVPWESLPWTTNIPRKVPKIANVARFSEEKGQDDLIKAMPGVISEYPDAILLLTGWGPYKNHLVEIANSLGVIENIKFLDKVENPYSVYYHSDIAAFPSKFEGFGLGLLEAMVFDCPIVATNLGPFREVLGSEYDLVPVQSPYALEKQMLKYLSSPEQSRRDAEQTTSRVMNKFSSENMGESYLRLYNSLVNY